MAIEFMLIIIVMLLYIQTVVQPIVNTSSAAVVDTTRVAQARFAAERLADAIGYVSSAPGDSRYTVHIYVPEGATVSCGSGSVGFTAGMSSELSAWPVTACSSGTCEKSFAISSSVNCSLVLAEKSIYTVKIEKSGGVVSVSRL